MDTDETTRLFWSQELDMSTALSSGDRGIGRTFASLWRRRYGGQLIFEIALCAALLIAYREIRTVNRTDLGAAFANARDVVRFEGWLGMPFEDNIQRWLLDHETIVKLLNHYYIWFHFPVAIGLLLWLYVKHPERHRGVRNLMVFTTFAALIIHLLFPLAPPRMMDGFVDTMRQYGPSIYGENALDGAANQIAAMPSLHFAWAMIEAIAIIDVLKSRWRWAALLHPILMTLSIIGTANHWWIDAAAAGLLVLGAISAWRVINRLLPERRWLWNQVRFQTESEAGIEQMESHANDSTEGRSPERVD